MTMSVAKKMAKRVLSFMVQHFVLSFFSEAIRIAFFMILLRYSPMYWARGITFGLWRVPSS
ncbi:MAG: hypothetical protein KJN65_10270, partial [Croceitalea sp.]|nr:hypothetical protein [Croceitalea sp.]